MRAIVIKQHGGPEVLCIEERPDPAPRAGHVLIEVKAFGLNRAETHMREGRWPQAAEISGIECAGVVRADPDGRFAPGSRLARRRRDRQRAQPGERKLAHACQVIRPERRQQERVDNGLDERIENE